jgi:hypothetical protein
MMYETWFVRGHGKLKDTGRILHLKQPLLTPKHRNLRFEKIDNQQGGV